jgi:hypothetical protein
VGLLDRFRKKSKPTTQVESAKPRQKTELEMLCGDDEETYKALADTMFLTPQRIETTMDGAAEKARKARKGGDIVSAATWYKIAGGLAIYEGNVKKVVEYFSEYEKLVPGKKCLLLEDPEKAVAKAREYYEKYLKTQSSETSSSG